MKYKKQGSSETKPEGGSVATQEEKKKNCSGKGALGCDACMKKKINKSSKLGVMNLFLERKRLINLDGPHGFNCC